MMKVPFSVISGKSPRKISWRIGSGISGPAKRTDTYKRARKGQVTLYTFIKGMLWLTKTRI
jgi:hypothetical protein